MKVVLHVCSALALGWLLAPASLADTPRAPEAKPEARKATTRRSQPKPADAQPAAETAPAESAPAPATRAHPAAPAASPAGKEAPEWHPMAGTTGTIGLFTVETGDTLPRRGFSFSTYVNRFDRQPGSLSVTSVGMTIGAGIRDWLSIYAQFEPHRHLHLDDPAELSLNSPTTNPPFPNATNPILFRALTNFPGTRPGYVEDFPFAFQNGGGQGEATVGIKVGLLSEQRGQAVSLSIRNDFIIPTQTGLTGLLAIGTQSGQFNDAFDVALSKTWHYLQVAGNLGYRFTRDPRDNGQVLFTQADQLRIGAGAVLFPRSRVQIMNEYTGIVFVGSATPNTTFGARDPVEGVWGARLYATKHMALDVGYRYLLNQRDKDHDDRQGFVIKLGFSY